MNQNEEFFRQKAEQDEAIARRLNEARSKALAEGKEPFDLRVMDMLWRDNPDMRMMARGLAISREERIADWSEKYYVEFPQVQTIGEFVAKMVELQLHGFFD